MDERPKIWTVTWTREGLMSLDEPLRLLLLGAAQAANELTLDWRLLMLASPKAKITNDVERNGRHMQAFYLMRNLAARCHEVDKMLIRNYERTGLSKDLYPLFDSETKEALTEARTKTNREDFRRIRNRFAFHMGDLGERANALRHVPEEGLTVCLTNRGNTYYYAAELILQFSLLGGDDPDLTADEHWARVRKEAAELPDRISGTAISWIVFLDGLIVAICARAKGLVAKQEQIAVADYFEGSDFTLPWFMRIDPPQKD